jgi:hypothetical protein
MGLIPGATMRAERNLIPSKNRGRMSLYESSTHSFIVKIWLEERTDDSDPLIWRGHITHVPSGQRRYMRNLDEMTSFVAIFLQDMGVQLGKCWRARQWLMHWGRAGKADDSHS